MLLPDPFCQFPELPARQRIDAGRWLVEHEKCWIMDEGATKPELLPHAAREFPCLPVLERRKARALGQFINAALALRFWLAEEAGEKGDILGDAQVRIKVLSEALRHVGDLEAGARPMAAISHITAEDFDRAGLDPPAARDEAQKGGFSDAVRAD